jgi:hypothetical protein
MRERERETYHVIIFYWALHSFSGSESLGPTLSTKAHFTLGVRADVQPKSSIPIGGKVEMPFGLLVEIYLH